MGDGVPFIDDILGYGVPFGGNFGDDDRLEAFEVFYDVVASNVIEDLGCGPEVGLCLLHERFGKRDEDTEDVLERSGDLLGEILDDRRNLAVLKLLDELFCLSDVVFQSLNGL